jgi:prophage regulatory protein
MKSQEHSTAPMEARSHRALREKDVLQQVRISKSQLWRLIQRGLFPKPVRISERCNAWDSQAVDAWLAAKFLGDRA